MNKTECDAMILANMGLVYRVAYQYLNGGMELEDLVGEGIFGLIQAVDQFDPTRNVAFSTYATWCIRGAICHAFNRLALPIRLPSDLALERRRVLRAIKRLENKGEFQSSRQRIAEEAGLPVARVRYLLTLPTVTESLDVTVTEDSTFGDLQEAPNSCVEDIVLGKYAEFWERVNEALNPRERHIIALRFGLMPSTKDQTLEQIGQRLGITKERVRQIEKRAIEKLQRKLGPRWRNLLDVA